MIINRHRFLVSVETTWALGRSWGEPRTGPRNSHLQGSALSSEP